MSDVVLEIKDGRLNNVYINGERQTLVRNAILNLNWPNAPILQLERYKPGDDGRPYTAGGGYVATLTEYYPGHGLHFADA